MGTVRRGSIVRRITAVTCIMLLLFTFLYVPASAQETTRSRSVNIRVVNADNVPIKGVVSRIVCNLPTAPLLGVS